jgi:acyl-coenzyme A synthetase/AMP-(fatty) acid ligase
VSTLGNVAGQVSPQKKLRGGVMFVESIPKTNSGKILRRELKTMLKSKL